MSKHLIFVVLFFWYQLPQLKGKIDGKMHQRFCANLSFLFTEKPFHERYQAAKNAGFVCVESGFPFDYVNNLEEIVEAKKQANIEQVLVNVYTGNTSQGELGFAAIPGREAEFASTLDMSLHFAKALGCKKLHIMSGRLSGPPTEENDAVFLKNMKEAVFKLKEANVMGLIEPLNPHTVQGYYLNTYDKALRVIKEMDSPWLKIMLDIFHLQQIEGDLSNKIKDYMPYTGHVQIAQVPNRNEPSTPGELDFKYIIPFIRDAGYTDWMGLEYKPLQNTDRSIEWIRNFGYEF